MSDNLEHVILLSTHDADQLEQINKSSLTDSDWEAFSDIYINVCSGDSFSIYEDQMSFSRIERTAIMRAERCYQKEVLAYVNNIKDQYNVTLERIDLSTDLNQSNVMDWGIRIEHLEKPFEISLADVAMMYQ